MPTNVEYLTKLIYCIDAAKDSSCYQAANGLFAHLIELADGLRHQDRNVFFSIETQDKTGEYHPEAYYDLLVVNVYGKTSCIPVPMVEFFTMVSIMKHAEIVERQDHQRECIEHDKEQKEVMLVTVETAGIELSHAGIMDAVRTHLERDTMKEVLPFWRDFFSAEIALKIDLDQLNRVREKISGMFSLSGSKFQNCEAEKIAINCIKPQSTWGVTWLDESTQTHVSQKGLDILTEGKYVVVEEYSGDETPPVGTRTTENGVALTIRPTSILLDYIEAL